MTRDDLKQIYFINKEIEMWERELEKVRTQAEVKTQRLSGMPFANTNEVNSPTEELAMKILDIELIILGKKKELEYKRYEILNFILNIEDSAMRMIVKFRCVDCKSWNEVGQQVNMSAEACKMQFVRFCKTQDEIKG